MPDIPLKFQLSRRDLFTIMRLTAGTRTFRKVAMPALAGFVFLGHAMDGNYGKGALWAVALVAVYFGVSNFMLLAYVYSAGNSTLLVPQEMFLHNDRIVVSSEHGEEEFDRPEPADVSATVDRLLVNNPEVGKLVFLRSSFIDPAHYEKLKRWAASGVESANR
jgi:hypothetical protein